MDLGAATNRTETTLDPEFDWLGALSRPGEERETALGNLREYLLKGLRRAFPSRNEAASLPLEDCVHEALVRITAGLGAFRGESRFTTWAMSIAVRITISESRRAHWRDVSLDEMIESGRAELRQSFHEQGEDGVAREQLLTLVRKTIACGLTEKQRAALEAELTGAPPEEVARRMNISRNTVYKLTYDARARLKKIIIESGWSEMDVRRVMGLAF